MSDRIAVMAAGKVEQLGSPTEVYENPGTAYVADFLGSANVVNVEVTGPGSSGRTAFRLGSVTLEAAGPSMVPGPGTLVVRPERIHLDTTTDDATAISATVERTVYLGAMSDVVVRLEFEPTRLRRDGRRGRQPQGPEDPHTQTPAARTLEHTA